MLASTTPRRVLPRLTVLAFAAALLVAVPAGALPRAKDRWFEVETTHFTLISNAGERSTRTIASDLEKFMAVLEGLIGRELESPLPSYVYVFKNESVFRDYKPLWQGKPANLSGYFQERSDGNLIAINGDRRLEAAGVLYHELMHYVMSSNYLPVPLWVDEGLAELYSTFEAGPQLVHVGKPIENHVFWLRQHSLIPLPELFAIDRESQSYNEGSRQGSFYAQSWLLVHYLLLSTDEQRRENLFQFLDLGRRGVATAEAFQRAFGIEFKTLEKKLKGYARRGEFYYQSLPSPAQIGDISPPRQLARHEILCQLGELLATLPDRENEAEAHLRAGLAAEPRAGGCHVGMGRVMESRQRLAEAETHYRQATEDAPDNFTAWYRWGLLRLESQAGSARQAGGFRDDSILSALRRSVELQPDFAPAWAALSYAYTFESEAGDDAIRAAERAHALLPTRPEVAQNLLYLYSLAGRLEPAQSLFGRFFANHDDPQQVRDAELTLLRFDVAQAEALIDAQRIEEAIAVLEKIEAAAAGAAEFAWVDEQLRETRSFLAEKRQVDRYNQAVDLFNSGDWRSARDILEEVAAQEPGGALAQAVRSTLEKVRQIAAQAGE